MNGINSISLRKAIDEGWVVGPRIFTSGKSLATTGGHADPTNGLKGDFDATQGRLMAASTEWKMLARRFASDTKTERI